MSTYVLTTDLSAYESAIKELKLWNRLKKYVRDNRNAIVAAIMKK